MQVCITCVEFAIFAVLITPFLIAGGLPVHCGYWRLLLEAVSVVTTKYTAMLHHTV